MVRKRILMVEDSAIVARIQQAQLDALHAEIQTAVNSEQALEMALSRPPDLFVVDLVMPAMDGFALCQALKADGRTAKVPLIVVTALARDAKDRALSAGADDFMRKPPDADELRVRLRAGERIVRLEQTLAEQNRTLREAQAGLVQAEKLASLGRLAAGMAHEINNPLAYVTNNLAVLRRDAGAALDALALYRLGRAADAARLEEEADLEFFRANLPRLADKTLEGLQRVRDIVGNLRDFARLDEAEFKEADVNEAVRSTVKVLAHEAGKNRLRVGTDLQPLPAVLCHPGKLNQVLLNLLLNAVDACGPGGAVTVRSRPEDGRGVVVEVADDGCGIKPEHLPRLFEPFFTTKPLGQGTGLGLATAFGIVRDHGGSIEVDSAPGRGSTFRVRLPLRPPHAPRSPA